jgi:hypothetical protein
MQKQPYDAVLLPQRRRWGGELKASPLFLDDHEQE